MTGNDEANLVTQQKNQGLVHGLTNPEAMLAVLGKRQGQHLDFFGFNGQFEDLKWAKALRSACRSLPKNPKWLLGRAKCEPSVYSSVKR